MLDNHDIKSFAEEVRAKTGGVRSICRAGAEEVLLPFEGFFDRATRQDVFLGAADHANVAKTKRVNFSLKDVETVRCLIHQVDFGQNANSAFSVWVNAPSEFERV